MIAVVVGDIDRDKPKDKAEVLSLLDDLKNTFRDLIIVSAACERGIGQIVRSRCLKNQNKNPEFSFVEVSIRPWATLSKAKLTQIYTSRNATLQEIGEVFHIFSSGWSQGHIADLIKRVKEAKRPLVIHDNSGKVTMFNYPESKKSEMHITDSIKSTDFKNALE